MIGGLVDRPTELSLAELRELPSRTQITRHDCVEGWSAIGKWSGVQLAPLLQSVRPQADARYSSSTAPTRSRAATARATTRASTSIDAFHPQTILAYDMNGAAAAGRRTARRCGCASSASSATSRPST